jgi:hypothetical protein
VEKRAEWPSRILLTMTSRASFSKLNREAKIMPEKVAAVLHLSRLLCMLMDSWLEMVHSEIMRLRKISSS